jgi:hypothetical protein
MAGTLRWRHNILHSNCNVRYIFKSLLLNIRIGLLIAGLYRRFKVVKSS